MSNSPIWSPSPRCTRGRTGTDAKTNHDDSDDRAGDDDRYDPEELKSFKILKQHRQDKGLPALILSNALTLASERHSKDMGLYDFFAYDSAKSSYFPTGSKPWDRMTRSGYDYPSSSRVENLVADYDTARKAFKAWRASPGHNRNILNRNQQVIGITRVPVPGSKYGWYWTTDFGSEKDPTAHVPGEIPSPERKQAPGKEQGPRARANNRG